VSDKTCGIANIPGTYAMLSFGHRFLLFVCQLLLHFYLLQEYLVPLSFRLLFPFEIYPILLPQRQHTGHVVPVISFENLIWQKI